MFSILVLSCLFAQDAQEAAEMPRSHLAVKVQDMFVGERRYCLATDVIVDGSNKTWIKLDSLTYRSAETIATSSNVPNIKVEIVVAKTSKGYVIFPGKAVWIPLDRAILETKSRLAPVVAVEAPGRTRR